MSGPRMRQEAPIAEPIARNPAIGLKAYLEGVAMVTRAIPAAWVRCELHTLRITDRYTRMEFIELDHDGRQTAKVQGGCRAAVWRRVEGDFAAAGMTLRAGSRVMVRLRSGVHPVYGFQVEVEDVDLTFALGDLNARMQAIRKHLRGAGLWDMNRSLPRPVDFVRVSVIAPGGAAGLGDFRSTADPLAAAGLVDFTYHEVPFQNRDAPLRIVEALRAVYRESAGPRGPLCAVAIIRGGGASADLAWLVDRKLAEAVCRMNVPVVTGIGHERDRNLLDEIACISCDTPSKVIEHIRSSVVGAALGGERALASIRSDASRMIERIEASVGAARASTDRDGREMVRVAEGAARHAAAAAGPRASVLLDASGALVSTSRRNADEHSRNAVHLAGGTVRDAAVRLEPGVRSLLDDLRSTVTDAGGSVRMLSQRSGEIATTMVRDLHGRAGRDAAGALRPLELEAAAALSTIRARVDALPEAAEADVERAHRSVIDPIGRAVDVVCDLVGRLRHDASEDAVASLDGIGSALTTIVGRVDALDPRNVLAAGYAILRNGAGRPLTGIAAVIEADRIVVEMQDGSTPLLGDDERRTGDWEE